MSGSGFGAGTASRTGFDGSVSLSYDAASGGYVVRDGSVSRSFAAGDRSAADSNDVLSVYAQSNAGRSDHLVLFNPGAGNTVLPLSYVSYGAWQTTVEGASTLDISQRYFVYGIRQASTAPSTGSASYRTTVDGFWTTDRGYHALSGTSNFTADFSAMTVATNLDLTGTDILSNPNSPTTRWLGMFEGRGTIASTGGAFAGTFTHLNGDPQGDLYSGGFDGAFFGPNGEEMGYVFSLTGTRGSAVGVVVGKGE